AVFENGGLLLTVMSQAEQNGIPADTIFSRSFEKDRRAQVSQTCKHFAQHGEWPKADPALQVLVYERLKAAREFLWLLHGARNGHGEAPLQIADHADRSSLLNFLLVDYWAQIALDQWLFRYGKR